MSCLCKQAKAQRLGSQGLKVEASAACKRKVSHCAATVKLLVISNQLSVIGESPITDN